MTSLFLSQVGQAVHALYVFSYVIDSTFAGEDQRSISFYSFIVCGNVVPSDRTEEFTKEEDRFIAASLRKTGTRTEEISAVTADSTICPTHLGAISHGPKSEDC